MKVVLSDELFLSDSETAQDANLLDEHGIRSVLALGVSFAAYEKNLNCDYKFFHVDDAVDEHLPWDAAYEWLQQAEKPVLVHCDLGLSRSPAICMYYLMKQRKMTYDEALAHLQGVTQVKLNEGFRRQLYVWELDVIFARRGWIGSFVWLAQQFFRGAYRMCFFKK